MDRVQLLSGGKDIPLDGYRDATVSEKIGILQNLLSEIQQIPPPSPSEKSPGKPRHGIRIRAHISADVPNVSRPPNPDDWQVRGGPTAGKLAWDGMNFVLDSGVIIMGDEILDERLRATLTVHRGPFISEFHGTIYDGFHEQEM